MGGQVADTDFETNMVSSSIAGRMSFLRELFKKASQTPGRGIWAKLIPDKSKLSYYALDAENQVFLPASIPTGGSSETNEHDRL